MCKSLLQKIWKKWLRNIQASTPFFTHIHGPRLHEGTSKDVDMFESLTENVSVLTIWNICAGVNIGQMGQPQKNHLCSLVFSFLVSSTKYILVAISFITFVWTFLPSSLVLHCTLVSFIFYNIQKTLFFVFTSLCLSQERLVHGLVQ